MTTVPIAHDLAPRIASLEIGWVPRIAGKTGCPRAFGPGFCENEWGSKPHAEGTPAQ